MATLLVALAVMAVLMSAVLPAWRHQATREKEAELAFRGEQYVRAIQLWERKMGPGSRPPNFDMLVQQKFLRKKYKDPMTEDGEFQPVYAGVNPSPSGQPGQPGRGGRGPGAPQNQPQTPQTPQLPQQPIGGAGIGGGGIHGVMSKSKESSIRVYKGATRYNEWRFIHAGAANTPGGVPGQNMPGGRGGRGLPGMGDGRGGFPTPDGRRGAPGGRGVGPGIGPGGFGPPGGGGPGGRGRGQ